MAIPVPIRVIGEDGAAVPGMGALFFWLEPSGEIARIADARNIHDGVAVYDGPPLPDGLSFGVSVIDQEWSSLIRSGQLPQLPGLPLWKQVFRSGRLAKLPGPPSDIAATSRINVLRTTTPVAFGINSDDGAPHLVRQHLAALRSQLRIDNVLLASDEAGHEVVTVKGRVRHFGFFWRSFTRTLVLSIGPAGHPGRPQEVVGVGRRDAPPSGSGAPLGGLASTLDQAIIEGVRHALDVAIRRIAGLVLERFDAGFAATFVSLTSLAVLHSPTHPGISMQVHGGAITGVRDLIEPG